jgi:hypothetical protein
LIYFKGGNKMDNLFGFNFDVKKDIAIDENGKVVISNPNVAESIKKLLTTPTGSDAVKSGGINIGNCGGCAVDPTKKIDEVIQPKI